LCNNNGRVHKRGRVLRAIYLCCLVNQSYLGQATTSEHVAWDRTWLGSFWTKRTQVRCPERSINVSLFHVVSRVVINYVISIPPMRNRHMMTHRMT